MSTALYVKVLTETDLGYAFCLGSLQYVVVPLMSWVCFKESFSRLRIAGMGVLLVGIVVIIVGKAMEDRARPKPPPPERESADAALPPGVV